MVQVMVAVCMANVEVMAMGMVKPMTFMLSSRASSDNSSLVYILHWQGRSTYT